MKVSQTNLIDHASYRFRLYATMDCIFTEPDRTLHILDFKTGKSAFDQRQALVYCWQLAISTKQQAASFYNLERCTKSALISVSSSQWTLLKTSWAWWLKAPARFAQLPAESQSVQPNFPQFGLPLPLPFHTICEFSAFKPSK